MATTADQTAFDQNNALFFRGITRGFLQQRLGAPFNVGNGPPAQGDIERATASVVTVPSGSTLNAESAAAVRAMLDCMVATITAYALPRCSDVRLHTSALPPMGAGHRYQLELHFWTPPAVVAAAAAPAPVFIQSGASA